ncbi:MAG: hypothetical protein D3905_16925, partial [Candidatus Electrothrix sp. AS4_5]|nr:hypothetical protein [Candidatus Electrothrix gigas]
MQETELQQQGLPSRNFGKSAEKGTDFFFSKCYVKRYRMKQIILSGETITRPLLQEEEAEADESGQQQKHSHPRFH